METKTHKGTHIVFQEDSGLYPINGKLLNKDELNKLMAITDESTGWIIIENPFKTICSDGNNND
jgi:hypothetical protein